MHFLAAGGETPSIAEEMAAVDALKRMFEIRPSDFVFKFGKPAYDLNYAACEQENQHLSAWTSGHFKRNRAAN